MNTPIKTHHALILNRLAEMQRVMNLVLYREELALAEQTILSQETELNRIAAILTTESERTTALLTDLRPLLSVLTSDAAADMHPMLKMAVRGFLKLHPELEP